MQIKQHKKGQNLLVLMGQRECPHSQKAKEKFHQIYIKHWDFLEKNNVDLVYVEAYDEHDRLSTKYNIQAYPTVVLILEGTVFKFPSNQDVDAEGLITFMKIKLNFGVKEVRKVEDVQKLFKRSDYAVLYYGEQDHPRYKLFLEVANAFQEVPFVWSDAVNVQWKYKLRKNTFSIVYLDGAPERYDLIWRSDKMKHWVYARVKPIFIEPKGEYDEDWIEDHEGPLVWVFLGMRDANRSQEVFQMIKANELVFKKSVHTILCWDANVICEKFAIERKFVDWTNVPQIKGDRGSLGERMSFAYYKKKDSEVTEKTFLKWMHKFTTRTLKPEFMKQDIPLSELAKSTNEVKSLSWGHMSHLFQLEHDKLILFYDSRDPTSKKERIIFRKIAKQANELEWHHLHVGEFDVSKNSDTLLDLYQKRLPLIRIYHKNNIKHVDELKPPHNEAQCMRFVLDHSSKDLAASPEKLSLKNVEVIESDM